LPILRLLFCCLVLGLALATPAAQEPTPPQESTPPQERTPAPDAAAKPVADEDKPKKPPRPGIAVDDPLVHTHCARCHALDDRSHMTRISYVRKSPEGWSESIKRMGRLHGLTLSPNDARQLVRSLSNSHGLARSEAERGLYESERRVHWSEAHHDQDFQRACAQCHPLGRVLLQQRDAEEWQLLRATHVAMFPLARGQMGGGPPEEERRRDEGESPAGAGPRGRGGAGGGGAPGSGGEGGGERRPTQGVGDRVLQQLAKDQPLFTPAWDSWAKNRRQVPLAATWTVTGHEVGRGDIVGTAELRRADDDEYDVTWNLTFADGSSVVRTGKGLLYAGYSWRGRSQADGEASWREVLLLDDDWQHFKGRLFTGEHDEVGADVELWRDRGLPRVLALGNRAITVPSTGHRLEVHGEAFPATLSPADFFAGEGLTITAVERHSDRRATLVVDAAAGSTLGSRLVAFGAQPGGAQAVLYDTVDYVRIRPLQGLARIGGLRLPKQIERFEAIAMHRGKDEKPFTEDDVDLFQVRPRWSLEEFRVRDDDDDLLYVGAIDAATGVFTPNVDGPNPARKWQANNVGDVFVVAEVDLDVPVRPTPPKPDAEKPAAKPAEKPAQKPADPPAAPAREQKTFRARAHLIVTVPLYVRWHALDWEDR
jgi:quinohemoprotein amine dehydrogenase